MELGALTFLSSGPQNAFQFIHSTVRAKNYLRQQLCRHLEYIWIWGSQVFSSALTLRSQSHKKMKRKKLNQNVRTIKGAWRLSNALSGPE